VTPDEIDLALSDLTTRMERVRALYEQYFMGIERLEPTIARKDLDRRLEALRKTPFQNTARRFKFQTLVQRYTSLQQYWYRTCRDIENGVYRKHVQKAQRRFAAEEQAVEGNLGLLKDDAVERAPTALDLRASTEAELAALLDADGDPAPHQAFTAPPGVASLELKPGARLLGALGKRNDGDPAQADAGAARLKAGPSLTLSQLKNPAPVPKVTATGPHKAPTSADPAPATRPTSTSTRPISTRTITKLKSTPPPAARPPAAPPAAASPNSPNLSRERIAAIHADYQRARAETNASAVSFEKLERNIRETEAQLLAKHHGKSVDFDVSVKDGKAILKPRLK